MTEHTLSVDIAIIGGGPAGMAAAAELSGSGLRVILIDAYPQLGGHYYRQPAQEFGEHAISGGHRQHEFEQLCQQTIHEDVQILHQASIWSAVPTDRGFDLHLTGPSQTKTVQTKLLLAATGAYDRPFPFPGWHLPGVITLGGAQMLLKGHGIVSGKRILVGGSGPLLLAAAAGLIKAGANVVAVLDMAGLFDGMVRSPFTFWGQWSRLSEGWEYVRAIRQAGVPIKFGQTILEATGDTAVESVTYGSTKSLSIHYNGVHQQTTTVEVDTICAALGFLPNTALTQLLKCEHQYDARLDAFYPMHDQTMASSVPNLFVAGDVTGVGGKELSRIQGQIAAWSMLQKLGVLSEEMAQSQTNALRPVIAKERRILDLLCERMRIKPEFSQLLRDDTVVCRCEMVTVGEIKTSIAQGANDLRGVKLRTRCGMGACQSRYCERTAASIIVTSTQQPLHAIGTSSIRPPIIPVLARDLLNVSE